MDDSGECHCHVIKGVMHSIFSVLQCLDETGAGNCFLRDYCIFFDTNTKILDYTLTLSCTLKGYSLIIEQARRVAVKIHA